MKTYKTLRSLIVIIALSVSAISAQAAEYSFKVYNTTNSTIIRLLVSEDSQTWGYFDIGSGIGAGESVTLTWAENTNNENCIQYFKAIFEGEVASAAVRFDFCESNLELAF